MRRWLLLLILISVSVVAQDAQDQVFSPTAANKTLDQLSIKLSTEELNPQHLQDAVNVLLDLQEGAEDCVDESQSVIDQIELQLQAIGTEQVEEKLLLQRKQLEARKKDQQARQASCRLFVIRSKEAVSAFSATIQQQVTSELLRRNLPIWENIADSPNFIASIYQKYNHEIALERSGFRAFNLYLLVAAGALFLLALLVGFRVSTLIKHKLALITSMEQTERFNVTVLAVLQHYLPALVPICILTLFFAAMLLPEWPLSYLLMLMLALIAYFFYMMLARIWFYPPKPAKGLVEMKPEIAILLLHRLQFLGMFSVFSFMTYQLMADQDFAQSVMYLLTTSFVVIMSFLLVSILWLINKLPKLQEQYHALRIVISVGLMVSLFAIVFAEVMGYHNLSRHVLRSIAITTLLASAGWMVLQLILPSIHDFTEGHRPWQQRIHRYLGLRRNEALSELIWLRFVIYTVVIAGVGLWILRAWGLTETDARRLIDAVVDGFAIGNIHVYPSRILFALLFFSVFTFFTRFVRSYFRHSVSIVKGAGAREAIATIIGYIGFGLAIVLALLIAGVNFTGIAIIAGALSVGIGFGLQNIVSNFVSGIILLIERPIKIGDRIIVGGTEGYVHKISIRSTRIHTQQRTDVIVPNSEMIAAQVTNMMFHDANFRIEVPVGVAYGSDVELVKKLMLEVAEEHEDIVSDDESRKPRVLFRMFGDNSLHFELWVITENVNRRHDIHSDIHFAIDKKFREHHIEISFPQRDIHIRSWPESMAIVKTSTGE